MSEGEGRARRGSRGGDGVERELIERARQQRTVARLGQTALSGIDLDQLFDEAVRAVRDTLHVDYAAVLEVLPRGEDLRLRAGIGWMPGWVGRRTVEPGRGSQAGYTLLENGPVIVDDLRTEVRFHEPELLLAHDVVSGMSTIIAGRAGAWGVLGAHSRRERRFADRDIDFLQAIANVSGATIERDRVEREQRFLSDASATLTTSLDYETTLERLVDLVTQRLADWCMVYVHEASERKLRRVTGAHADPEKVPLVRDALDFTVDPAADTPVGRVFRTGRPVLLAEAPETLAEDVSGGDPAHQRVLNRLGIRSLMILPIVARGRTLGALTMASSGSGRTFRSADLTLAQELARRAAFAVDNARLYQAAEAASRVKSDFLAVMSHELRTPLNAIIGFADLLEVGVAGSLSNGQRRQTDRIKASASHLRNLIDEILTFSRLESGRAELRVERVDLALLTEDVADAVRPTITDKGLDFRLEVPGGPLEAETDPVQLRRVLLALLGNAVSFTEEGEIRLRLTRRHGAARFDVRDTGIGIAPEDREKVFRPFWQVRGGLTRTVGGTGLGLTVARRLARMLGGDVEVESRPGAGSTFTVWIPTNGAPAAA